MFLNLLGGCPNDARRWKDWPGVVVGWDMSRIAAAGQVLVIGPDDEWLFHPLQPVTPLLPAAHGFPYHNSVSQGTDAI